MNDTHLFIGDHAETLSSGRRLAPGDTLPEIGDDEIGQRLITDGLIVELTPPDPDDRPASRGRRQPSASADQQGDATTNQEKS